MSRINDLLRQLEASNPALAKDLRREVDALSDRRAFGLNFERHQPEAVELPGRKVRRGDKVHVLPERGKNPTKENEKLWQVVAIDRTVESPTATLEPVQTSEVEVRGASATSLETSEGPEVEEAGQGRLETTVPLEDLVVVAEFRDPIYPGLVSTGEIKRGGDKPFHTVINAENYHALQTLLFTHRGEVDCIYIDPPYNTGNEGWIYNDKYVAGDDLYKHSKWLAFMERRLLLAKELLKSTGVILVAIGDQEHHRLRMLLDQIFDSQNFISDVVWQGGRKNDSRFVSASSDYMLIFGRSVGDLVAADVRWSEPKSGADDVVAAGLHAWEESENDAVEATRILKTWWRGLPADHPAKADRGLKMYDKVDDARPGEVYRASDLASPNPRVNLMFDVAHPVTGKPVRMHKNGWRYSRETMAEKLKEGRILFGPDHEATAAYKRYLTEASNQTPMPCFTSDRATGSDQLLDALGEKRFPNPKDRNILMRWLRMVAPADGVIVDFFGGSGTTAEAVMRLNTQDGGNRRCILVTNNEAAAADAKKLRRDSHRAGDPEWEAKGVYEYVAKPRITTVATGVREDGSTYSEGLDQNVEFFTLTYEAPLRVASNREFAKIAPLLWMRAGSQGRRIDQIELGWDVADTYGVLADLDQSEKFLKAVTAASDALRMAFIVTDEERLFTTLCRELPDHVEPVRLYESYLRNFEIESGRGAR